MTIPTVADLAMNPPDGHHPLVRLPGYDRSTVTASIVHIGVGGFHRAHLATYVDELCELGEDGWGIVGAGILPSDQDMADVLRSQDHLYTLITRGPHETSVAVVGSIVDFILANDDPGVLIERIADPATQVVSLTITEAGYPIDDITGTFQPESAAAGDASAFGILARGLHARMTSNGLPLTVLSCDNIMSNGIAARTATMGEASRLADGLVEWIDTSVSFPNSMVDRITPATSDADRAWLETTHGFHDAWPVVTEPFRQWVVEDSFAGERMPLEKLDVIVTNDVEPYELMKLRLLNAGHSCLAYLAALDGIERVDEALADDTLRAFLAQFLKLEAQPVLPPIPGIDIDAYIASLVERFANPAIGDQIARLCLDGSAKFPKFLLPTVRAQLAGPGNVDLSAMALAGWCEYLRSTEIEGKPLDHAADALLLDARAYAEASSTDAASFLNFEAVFGTDLVADDTFRAAFIRALHLLRTDGVRSAVKAVLQEA